jgi:hypothetical protein
MENDRTDQTQLLAAVSLWDFYIEPVLEFPGASTSNLKEQDHERTEFEGLGTSWWWPVLFEIRQVGGYQHYRGRGRHCWHFYRDRDRLRTVA